MTQKNIRLIVDAYVASDYGFITEFIKQCPENVSTQSSLTMLTSNDPFYVICAFDGMAGAYTHGYNYDYALFFGISEYECLHHYFFNMNGSRKDEMLSYAASSSYLVTKSYLDTAKYDEGIQFYEKAKNDFGNYFNSPEFTSLQLNAVELYLGKDALETARRIFDNIPSDNIPYYSRINYDRLRSKLNSLFSEISVIPEEANESAAKAKAAEIQGMIDAHTGILAQTQGDETEVTKRIIAMLENMKGSMGYIGDDDKKTFENATSVYSTLFDYMKSVGGGGQDSNLAELRQQLQNYQSVFDDETKGFDQDILKTTLYNLQQLLTKFENKYIEETKNTLWSIQICQKKLEQFSEGANTLEQLRKLLEADRLQIKNKTERAGVFKAFKYLFPNLVELYYQSENAKGVIKAIEASKGRLLADAIAEQTNNEIQVDNYELPIDKLPSLLLENKANYLSFFIDDEYSISTLITSNGKFYAGYIPVGKITIGKWVQNFHDDPKQWKGKGAMGFFSKNIDIPKELEKFLNILNIAINEGNLKIGDHLVYSPDDMLFLFPLHYAQFNNKYLIEQFSLSKIHGAYQLVHLLEGKSVPYKNAVCFCVPAQQDLSDSEKVNRFSEVKLWLDKNLSETINISEQNTVKELFSVNHINSIIHFSTHGVFPKPGMETSKANPYYNSGLVLRDGEQLPELESYFNYYGKSNFLNPQKLFESDKNWQNSHITFQACVSARSKEGVGGDALGMESAAFFCGAASMLTAGWNIPLEWANKFCIYFYEFWLREELSKGDAYKKAMLEMLKAEMPSDFPAPYYWAGMILSGDWR